MNNILCKHCGSQAIIKRGTYKGTQLYWCKACQRKFKGDDALFHMKVSAQHISSALDMYYKGLSFRNIADHMQQEHNYRPSKSVIYKWVDKYTTMAIDHFRNYQPHVGNTWVADETMLDIDNRKVWFWDIVDADTRFLLASRVSLTRTTEDAEQLMKAAMKRAGKSPKLIVTDKLRAYLDGIELTFGSDTEHLQTSPFTLGDSTALIERFHGTLKDRTKVMRGFKDTETLIEFTDGFLVYYNFLRPHEGLGGRTPADVAKVDYSVKNWSDVSRLPVSKEAELKTHKMPSVETVKTRIEVSKTKVRRKKVKRYIPTKVQAVSSSRRQR
jgi:putative transposase